MDEKLKGNEERLVDIERRLTMLERALVMWTGEFGGGIRPALTMEQRKLITEAILKSHKVIP